MPSRTPFAAVAALLAGMATLPIALARVHLVEGAAEEAAGEDTGVVLSEAIEADLDLVLERGTLRVGLPTDSTTYLMHRGAPKGFEYEALQQFAAELGVELEVARLPARPDRLRSLLEGEVDVIGGRLQPAGWDEVRLRWSEALYETPAALVQRDTAAPPLPPLARDAIDAPPTFLELEARPIRSPEDLAGRTVWARHGTGHSHVLAELSDELGQEIEIVEVSPRHPADELVRWVASGQVRLTVTQADLARLRASAYQNIRVAPVLSDPQPVALAVRETSPALQAALNTWIDRHREALASLHHRYFVDRRIDLPEGAVLDGSMNQLSEFDPLFRAYAEPAGLDWRLVASQAWQESRFRPRATSWAGAAGLMQIMPATARELGIDDRYDPEQSVRGAVDYLLWLDGLLEDDLPDAEERIKFVLAAYNAGLGHVQDAQRLAEAHGDDPTVWEDVAFWLLKLSDRRYYRYPPVKYGYCRGLEPVLYVEHILRRYQQYRDFTDPP